MRKWGELSTGLFREPVPSGSQPLPVSLSVPGLRGSGHLAGPSGSRGLAHSELKHRRRRSPRPSWEGMTLASSL